MTEQNPQVGNGAPGLKKLHFSVYCDGSSNGTATGAIGWGWRILVNGIPLLEGYGGFPTGTNNIAELMGAREGLKHLLGHRFFQIAKEMNISCSIELVSDSLYALGLANGSYSANKNKDLADHLRSICVQAGASTRWVRGHSGNKENERCDVLAKKGKDEYCPPKVLKRREKKARKLRKNGHKNVELCKENVIPGK